MKKHQLCFQRVLSQYLHWQIDVLLQAIDSNDQKYLFSWHQIPAKHQKHLYNKNEPSKQTNQTNQSNKRYNLSTYNTSERFLTRCIPLKQIKTKQNKTKEIKTKEISRKKSFNSQFVISLYHHLILQLANQNQLQLLNHEPIK